MPTLENWINNYLLFNTNKHAHNGNENLAGLTTFSHNSAQRIL